MNTDERQPDAFDRELDEQLRAAFAPPPATTFAAAARTAIGGPRASGWRHRVWPWLLAAAALLATAALLVNRPQRGPEGHTGPQLGAMWAVAYEHALAEGFSGRSCCVPDLDLAKACEERFASKLGLGPAGSVKLLGCYCGKEPTGGCMTLLARTHGDPVAVYVLRCDEDPRPELPQGSPLHLARREMGPLVLYSLSKSAMHDTLAEFVVP